MKHTSDTASQSANRTSLQWTKLRRHKRIVLGYALFKACSYLPVTKCPDKILKVETVCAVCSCTPVNRWVLVRIKKTLIT